MGVRRNNLGPGDEGVPRPMSRLVLLGGFRLTIDDDDVAVTSAVAQSLLAFLALHGDVAHTRVRLAGLLWPDLPEDRSRRRLTQTVWRLRNECPDGRLPVTVSADSLQFDASKCSVDAVEAIAALERFESDERKVPDEADLGRLIAVERLFSGSLLPGHYDEWMADERSGFERRHLRVLQRIVTAYRRQGELDHALDWAQQVVENDPLSEAAYRQLMQILLLLNRPGDARRAFAALEATLQDEFSASPSAETKQLAELIDRQSTDDSQALVESPIVGRRKELRMTGEAVSRCALGAGGVLVLEGEAGSGKTLMLEDVVDTARAQGLGVVWASHSERMADRPFGGLAGGLRRSLQTPLGEHVMECTDTLWLDIASAIIPPLQAKGHTAPPALHTGQNEWRQQEAMTQLLLSHAAARPMVLILDDLHWSDAQTTEWLLGSHARLVKHGVLIVIAHRLLASRAVPHVDRVFDAFDENDDVIQRHLKPLSRRGIRWLIESLDEGRRPDEEEIEQMFDQTGGNPFSVVETFRAAKRDGVSTLSLVDVLGERIDGVSPTARDVIGILAVLDRSMSEADLVMFGDLDAGDVAGAVADLIAADLVAANGRGIAVRHERVRAIALDRLEAAERRELHERAVERLARLTVGHEPTPWNEIARHARDCDRWRAAADAHRKAADVAAGTHATSVAAHHLSEALEIWRRPEMSPGAGPFVSALLDLEVLLCVLGDRAGQAALLDEIDRVVEGDRDGARPADVDFALIRRRRAGLLAGQSKFDEALGVLNGSDRDSTASKVLRGRILNWAGRAIDALPVLEDAIQQSVAEGSNSAEARAVLGSVLCEVQDFDEALRQLSLARSEADEAGDLSTGIEVRGYQGNVLSQQGRSELARSAYLEAIDLARRAGHRRGEGVNLVNLGVVLGLAGRGGEAFSRFDEAEDVFQSIGENRGLAFVRANRSDLACWLLGDLEAANAGAKLAADFFFSVRDERHEAICLDVLSAVARMQSRKVAARRHLGRGLRNAERSGDRFQHAQLLRTSAELEFARRKWQLALEEIVAARSLAKEAVLDSVLPSVIAFEAKVLCQLGRTEEAAEAAELAAGMVTDQSDLAYRALWWAGETLQACVPGQHADDVVSRAHEAMMRALDGLDPKRAKRALIDHPENAALDVAFRKVQDTVIDIRLPHYAAPNGRPLRDDEWVEVRWTVERASDFEHAHKGTRRRVKLLRLLNEASDQHGAPRIEDLAQVLGTGTATIKRDLAELRADGFDAMTRGTRGQG